VQFKKHTGFAFVSFVARQAKAVEELLVSTADYMRKCWQEMHGEMQSMGYVSLFEPTLNGCTMPRKTLQHKNLIKIRSSLPTPTWQKYSPSPFREPQIPLGQK
jgi:hypothetical protein